MNDEKYIGLDVHQATIVLAVMDATGKVVMEPILETSQSSDRLGKNPCSAALLRCESSSLLVFYRWCLEHVDNLRA